MTEDRMALIEAIQKADDGNFQQLAETVLQIIMDADVEALIGATAGMNARMVGSPIVRLSPDGRWRRGSVDSTCASRSCARDHTFPAFWSRAGRWRRLWCRSSRKPGSAGYRPALMPARKAMLT